MFAKTKTIYEEKLEKINLADYIKLPCFGDYFIKSLTKILNIIPIQDIYFEEFEGVYYIAKTNGGVINYIVKLLDLAYTDQEFLLENEVDKFINYISRAPDSPEMDNWIMRFLKYDGLRSGNISEILENRLNGEEYKKFINNLVNHEIVSNNNFFYTEEIFEHIIRMDLARIHKKYRNWFTGLEDLDVDYNDRPVRLHNFVKSLFSVVIPLKIMLDLLNSI